MNEVFKKYFSHITRLRQKDVELTSFQKQLISLFLSKNNISILKPRQIGFTSTFMAYILFLIESNSSKKDIVIITPNKSSSDFIMNTLSSYLLNNFSDNISDNFKFYFSKGLIKVFDYDISLITPSKLINSYSLRCFIPDVIIVDEADFIGEKNFRELEFLFPIILSRRGQIICGSTPNKNNSFFSCRHVKGNILSNLYKRSIILEKKQKKLTYHFEIPLSIDLREVFFN